MTNVYILYCHYVLCIRPKIKYLFCSVLLFQESIQHPLCSSVTHYMEWNTDWQSH